MELILDTIDTVIKPGLGPEILHFKDDQEAILQCQRGNRQAFGFLVQKYMQRAYYSALGLVGSHDSAVDLSQEAFIRAFRSMKKFQAGKNFFTWYYRILRNLCFNHLRDRARHARPFSEIREEELESIMDSDGATGNVIERNETQRLVWEALESLIEQEREIIILKDMQDLSYKEIAEVYDCPVGTVMSRLFTARQALKAKLERLYS